MQTIPKKVLGKYPNSLRQAVYTWCQNRIRKGDAETKSTHETKSIPQNSSITKVCRIYDPLHHHHTLKWWNIILWIQFLGQMSSSGHSGTVKVVKKNSEFPQKKKPVYRLQCGSETKCLRLVSLSVSPEPLLRGVRGPAPVWMGLLERLRLCWGWLLPLTTLTKELHFTPLLL